MIHVITAANRHLCRAELDQPFRLRHRTFVEQLGWADLARPDGGEVDAFDDDHVIHMVALKDGVVIRYRRLTLTGRAHLLSEIMPQLCKVDLHRDPQIWECTRFCVLENHRRRSRTVNPVASAPVPSALIRRMGSRLRCRAGRL